MPPFTDSHLYSFGSDIMPPAATSRFTSVLFRWPYHTPHLHRKMHVWNRFEIRVLPPASEFLDQHREHLHRLHVLVEVACSLKSSGRFGISARGTGKR